MNIISITEGQVHINRWTKYESVGLAVVRSISQFKLFDLNAKTVPYMFLNRSNRQRKREKKTRLIYKYTCLTSSYYPTNVIIKKKQVPKYSTRTQGSDVEF